MTSYIEKEQDLFLAMQADGFRLAGGEKTQTTDQILESMTSVDTYMNSLYRSYRLQAAGPESFNTPAEFNQRSKKADRITAKAFEDMRTKMEYINELCETYGLDKFMPTDDSQALHQAAADYAAEIHGKTIAEIGPSHTGKAYDKAETREHLQDIEYETASANRRRMPSIADYMENDEMTEGYDY